MRGTTLLNYLVPSYFEVSDYLYIYDILILQDGSGNLITIKIEQHER